MGKLLGSQLHLFLVDAASVETMATAMRWIHIPAPARAALPMGRPAYPTPRLISPDTRDSSGPISCVLPDTTPAGWGMQAWVPRFPSLSGASGFLLFTSRTVLITSGPQELLVPSHSVCAGGPGNAGAWTGH